jgi:uncharacterized protein (TIGR00645 family)
MRRLQAIVETIVFSSRWLVVPFLIGLILGLAALVYKFLLKVVEFVRNMPTAHPPDVMAGILSLLDLTLVANLILIVICSSYANFVSPVASDTNRQWPEGLVNVGFADVKYKLLGSITAIAAVDVLQWFMDIERQVDNVKLAWVVGILLAFAAAMLLMALSDRLRTSTAAPDV